MAVTPQKVVRGTSVLFQELFVEEDGSELIPVDASAYPSISILSPTEELIQTGVGTSVPGSPGRWQFSWFVPADAELSTGDNPWRIEWVMLTFGGRQVTRSAEFIICGNVEALAEERQYFNLTFMGQEERLFIKFKNKQEEVSLTFTNGSQTLDYSGRINEVQQGQFYVYYADTDALDRSGCYMAVWKTRHTALSASNIFVQQVRVPEAVFWWMQPDFRMLIDKLQKKIGHVQAYSDADLYGYLLRGKDIINQTNPISTWSLGSFPGHYGMTTFLLAASAWWGLQAQYLSEGELSFNYSGQTVTLDVDRTSVYESAMSRLREYLDKELSTTKKNILRSTSIGAIATRPYDYGLTSLVTRVQSTSAGGSNSIMPLFSRLGLV